MDYDFCAVNLWCPSQYYIVFPGKRKRHAVRHNEEIAFSFVYASPQQREVAQLCRDGGIV